MGIVAAATPEEKWLALEYEYMMYFESKKRKCIEPATGYECNSAVELQLLHMRILVDFLLTDAQSRNNSKDKQTDVILGDLLPEAPVALAILIGKLSDRYHDRNTKRPPRWQLNKRLAHLTDKRGHKFEHGLVFAAIEGPLENLLEQVAQISGRPGLINHRLPSLVSLSNSRTVNSTSI